MTDTAAPLELLPRDLAPWRVGNTGIDYVHRFESGRPGPHVLINALTHGNEFCGMVAALHLLENRVRPRIGTLTVSFANVAAYHSFAPERPYDSRQLVHNLNRVWGAEQLDGSAHSPELARARELRPVLAAADHVLDLHSTSQDVVPFWVYPAFERNARAALAIGLPTVHLVMPRGLGSGVPLIEHGRHGQAGGSGVALVAECGQHFRTASGETAIAVTLGFLGHFGLVEAPRLPPQPPARRFELLETCMVETEAFAFVRPLVGFEVFGKGELIATDGAREIRALCDDCTVFMPTRAPIVGREGLYLTRPLAD
jgi:predicted deacylase